MLVIDNSWHKFYKDRINSSYQDYFNKRYTAMISFIADNFERSTHILEEGVGIGSLANALVGTKGFRDYYGFDNSPDMLNLCAMNTRGISLYLDDILHPGWPSKAKLVLTHGVLEHFEDYQIESIFDRYKQQKVTSVHYVPLSKYEKPSFGDERLLSAEYWISLVRPSEYYYFNDGYDLLIIKD